VLRHRVVLSYEGLADGVTPDDLLGQVLEVITMPDIPMRERGGSGGGPAWAASRR
jgi:MoxR-like ATPase